MCSPGQADSVSAHIVSEPAGCALQDRRTQFLPWKKTRKKWCIAGQISPKAHVSRPHEKTRNKRPIAGRVIVKRHVSRPHEKTRKKRRIGGRVIVKPHVSAPHEKLVKTAAY